MPNWCNNSAVITHSDPAELERLAEAARRGDFCDAVIPVPPAPEPVVAKIEDKPAAPAPAYPPASSSAAVIGAAERGATVVLSNSSAPSIERLYGSQAARKAGLEMARIPARRSINAKAAARGPVDELLVTNARASRLDIKLKMAKAGPGKAAARRTA